MELPHLRGAARICGSLPVGMLSGRPAIEFEVAEPGVSLSRLLTYVSNWDNFSWATWTAVRSCLSAVGILKFGREWIIYHSLANVCVDYSNS